MCFRLRCWIGVLVLASIHLGGCATALVDGVVVPIAGGSGFTLPQAHGKSGIYLIKSPSVRGTRYGGLILRENGACLFTFGFDHPPSEAELEASPGTAGRYVICENRITFETLAFDPGGRRYSIEDGTFAADSVTIRRRRFRDEGTWEVVDRIYRRYSDEPVSRPMNW